MPRKVDDFRIETLRLVLAAAQTADGGLTRKAIANGAGVSGSAFRTWLSGERTPTRDNLARLVYRLNSRLPWRLEVRDFCGDFAEDRIREKLQRPLAERERVRGDYLSALLGAGEPFEADRRPRMRAWQQSRVEWCRLGGFLQPLPAARRLVVPDTAVYPFAVYFWFWERNRTRRLDFSEQFRLSRKDGYADRDFAEIAYFLVREQIILAAVVADEGAAKGWYTGVTEFTGGTIADNFGWGRDRLVTEYGCEDLTAFAKGHLDKAVARLWKSYPDLRRFLVAEPE